MQLTVIREISDSDSTIGQLSINGQPFCYTLELPEGDGGPGFCIPAGNYQVIITYSPAFQRPMPLLLNVPGRSEIRVHYGNDAKDTEGCILVGTTESLDWIGNSREAFDNLYSQIESAINIGEQVLITVG